MIIGLCGAKGAGKDTAGSFLVEKYGFTRVSFADKLKQSAAACFGVSMQTWDTLKNHPTAYVQIGDLEGWVKSISVREFLQRYGTEAHRDIFGRNFWVSALIPDINPTDGRNYAVTDVRFENEAVAIKKLGGRIIQITRDGSVKDDSHVSEVGLSDSLIDGKVANNGSIEQLHVLLDTLMERINA